MPRQQDLKHETTNPVQKYFKTKAYEASSSDTLILEDCSVEFANRLFGAIQRDYPRQNILRTLRITNLCAEEQEHRSPHEIYIPRSVTRLFVDNTKTSVIIKYSSIYNHSSNNGKIAEIVIDKCTNIALGFLASRLTDLQRFEAHTSIVTFDCVNLNFSNTKLKTFYSHVTSLSEKGSFRSRLIHKIQLPSTIERIIMEQKLLPSYGKGDCDLRGAPIKKSKCSMIGYGYPNLTHYNKLDDCIKINSHLPKRFWGLVRRTFGAPHC